jgi:WD40 repeat protein
MGLRARAARFLLGDDVFVSYSRADGASYAARLAGELAKRGFACRFDQWACKPGADVPPELLRALGRAGVMVLISTAAAGASGAVETEIRRFLSTGRNLVPVDLDGTIRAARWWPLLEGLAVSRPEPLSEVLERIENTATFTRRNARLNRLAVGAVAVFGVAILLSVAAGKRAADAVTRAEAANRDRQYAERKRDEAVAQLRATEESLKQQTAVAQSRELARLASGVPPSERQDLLSGVIRAVETAPTEAARLALAAAIRNLISRPGDAPIDLDGRGRFAAAASRQGGGILADFQTNTRTALCGSPEPIKILSFSPDGNWLLAMRYVRRRPSRDGRYLDDDSSIWQLELWSTRAARPAHSISAVLSSLGPRGIAWAPDSTMFLVLPEDEPDGLRVSVDATGNMAAARQELVGVDGGIEFAGRARRFVTYPSLVGSDPVTLWDFAGGKLWSATLEGVKWVTFRNQDRTLIVERQRPEGRGFETEFKIVDLDESGKALREPLAPESSFDYALLAGGPLPFDPNSSLGARLARKNPGVLGTYGCNSIIGDPVGRVAVCFQDKREPILFDIASQAVRGSLAPWGFSMVRGYPTFSPDGSLLAAGASDFTAAVASDWTTVWSVATRRLLWKKQADGYSVRFSGDGKRLFVKGVADDAASDVCVFDARSGVEIPPLPAPGKLLWTNEHGTQAITLKHARPGRRDGGTLLRWDVDRKKVLASVGMDAADEAEEKADTAVLEHSPTAAQLLDIARRRLRACEARQ